MLNKKIILILTIFIVSLFAISSISAADNATSDVVSVEETDSISVDEADEVVSAEDNQVIIGNESDVGTFDELSSLIGTTSEGSTLELDKDYKYVNGSTEGIQINKAITIDGKGHTLDGNGLSRIFNINANNVVLSNITFINGYYKNSGGAIYCYMNEGHIVGDILNCTFINNSVKRDGGACFFAYSSFNIYNSTFINNTAGWDYGGAIYVVLENGECGKIINSNFYNNAIEGWGDFKSISWCLFDNSKSIVWHNADKGTIDKCLFLTAYNNICLDSCSNINIIKDYINLACNDISFNYSEKSNFSVKCVGSNNLTVNRVQLILDDGTQNILFESCSDNNGLVLFSNVLSKLTVGTWNVTVIFEGNDNYAPCNATATITVLPPSTSLTIDDVSGTVGQETNLNAKIIGSDKKPINEGTVTFFEGETNIGKANVVDGVATLTYTPTIAGEHSINAVFNSGNYGSSNNSAIVSVAKANVDLNIKNIGEVYFSTPSNFAVSVNSNSRNVNEGEVKFYVNNVLVGSSEVRDGIAEFNYITNATGSFILTVTYNGTDNYLPANIEGGFQVNKMPTTLTGESVIFDEEAYKTFTTELKDDNNNGVNGKPVKIEVIKYSGESATFNGISDSNGITVYDVGRLAGGMWYVTGIYAGDKNYIKSSFVDKFIVVKMNTTTDIEEISNPKINHNYKLKANIHDEDGKLVKEGIVQFYLDGVDIGSIDLSNNQGHQSALCEGVLGASDSMFEYELGAENDVYLNYVPTKAGKHTLTAVYEGTTLYRSSNSTTILDVSNSNKNGVTITAPIVNTVYNGGKYLVVTLKDAGTGKAISGVNVKVVLNGKTSNPTTNKNGQVKVSTNGLAPKNYTAKITFAGNSKYDKLSESAKVVVTKATPKMTAKATTFKKSDKTKKYTVTLKTNKNKVMKNTKVTLKVNGKTYSAKTNTKGQATFKLTKLTKKGKFTAIIKYAGSKYYNAKTVKPKITVK